MKWNTPARNAIYMDVFVAKAKGFFEKEGLAVETTFTAMPNPPVMLLTGAADIIAGTTQLIYTGAAEGADLAGIYSPGNVYEAWIAKPDITSPSQLRGATIGVFSLLDLDVIYTVWMMQQYGISTKEFTMVQVGISPAKVAAVKAGKIAAAPVYPPSNAIAVQDGLRQIFDTGQLKVQLPSMYTVLGSWAKKNEDTVIRFSRALNQAHTWLFDSANEEEAVKIISEWTQLAAAPARDAYRLFTKTPGLYTKSGEWTRDQFDQTVNAMTEVKMLTGPAPAYEKVALPQYRERAAGGN